MSNTVKNLAAVQGAEEFVTKEGPMFVHMGAKVDLRTINRAQAVALANDPKCAFLAWKDEKKRPAGQRGIFAPAKAEAKEPEAKAK